jgi:OOP family OmpA-OmpF porin
MRCNWRRWLWGVIPLVALGLAAAQLERDGIERDLADRAQRALAAKGAQWAVVNFSGRDVLLTGSAISDNEPGEAVAALRDVWGVGKIKSDAGLPKVVDPYVWAANRRSNRVRLNGHYPNRAVQQTIVGMTRASVPGLDLTNRMRPARGVPPTDTWLAGVSFALKQLASLKRGDVRLDGLALTISGEAENAEAYRAITAALKRGLPKGITLASMQIAAPVVSPFTWSAEFAGGQLVLSGHVTSESARTDLLAAARAAAGTDVVDRMEVAGGAPSGSAEAAAALIKEIMRLQSGSAEMKDAGLAVGGVAADEAQAQAVREGLRASLPPAFKVTDQIRVRERKVEPKTEIKAPEATVEAKPPETTAETKPAETKAEAKTAEPNVAVPPELQTKDTALATPPPVAPPPRAEQKPAAPQASPPPEAKLAPAAEAKPKTEPAPPPKLEPAPSPKVDLVVCRGDLAKLAAGNPVLFERGSAQIERAGLKALDQLAQAMKACPGVRVVAEGHTDLEGNTDYNQRLSLKRANAVAEHLVEAGVAPAQVQAAGFGTSRPVASNISAQTRAKNRRTEIVVQP